jgi:hypothetical protein
MSPIFKAVAANDLRLTVQLLTEEPELIVLRDRHGWTPLHQAAASSSLEVLLALLERGAEANARGRALETPLHLADTETATWLLIRYGADPRLADRNQLTPLDLVREHRQPGLSRMLRQAVQYLNKLCETPSPN